MNTDVALNYKAKLIEIENKIKEIKSIGFDVSQLNEKLDNIKLINSNNVKVSKKNSFDGFLTSDYTNAINNLNKLQAKLDEYNIYIKINYYTKYLVELDLTKENISEIINEIKLLLRGIRNSSMMDYEDEKHLVEPFYKMIFKVIYTEIYFYRKSDLLEYCKQDSIDSSFIANIVEEYLEEINLLNYKDIKLNYYDIKKNGNLSDILDLEFIKSIVFRDEKEKLEEDLKIKYSEIISEINKSNGYIKSVLKQRNSIEKSIEESQLQLHYYSSIRKLIKSIVSFAITLSIPVGVFFGSFHLCKNVTSIYSYQTKTSTYSTLNDDIIISNKKETYENEYSPENIAYLIRYEVLSDQEARKQTRNSEFSNYDELAAKYKLRKSFRYDLSFLGYDDIDKYIEYVKSSSELPEPKAGIVDVSSENDNYNNLVDYYEIVYKLVDLESKNYEGYGVFVSISLALGYSLLSAIVLCMVTPLASNVNQFSSKINECIYNKGRLKYRKRELICNTKLLLDAIGNNDALRKEFNIEMAKHIDLFIELGLVLPKEVISKEEKTKILSKRNFKK